MSNDLLFSILPREGKVALTKDEFKVQQVSKEANLRELSDEEKQLKAEEKESRQKQQKKNKQKKEAEAENKPQADAEQNNQPGNDPDNRPHLDIFV